MTFSFLATPDSLTFTTLKGKTISISSNNENFEKAKNIIKEIQSVLKNGFSEEDFEYTSLMNSLEQLINPSKKIVASGEVVIENGALYYEGVQLHNTLTDRIIWGIREGFDMKPYIEFLKNLMQNTSNRSIEQLFIFMERHKMGISDDGYILGYKRVKDDFKDIYTGTIDNSPGQVVKMKRNEVSDDPTSTCSKGLHFCAIQYLPSYGVGNGNKIVIVKINPKDIVSVPIDHDAAKVRCCEYLVLAEYTGDDKEDLLGSKPIFNDSEFYNNVNYVNDDNYDEYSEDEYSEEDEYPVDGDNYNNFINDSSINQQDISIEFDEENERRIYSFDVAPVEEMPVSETETNNVRFPEQVENLSETQSTPVETVQPLDFFGRPDVTANLEKLFKDL